LDPGWCWTIVDYSKELRLGNTAIARINDSAVVKKYLIHRTFFDRFAFFIKVDILLPAAGT
jgi:hypothetical protein